MGQHGVRRAVRAIETDQLAAIGGSVGCRALDDLVASGGPAVEIRFEAAIDQGGTHGSDGGDGEGHGGDVRVEDAIVGPVGERIGSGVAGGRRVGEAAVRIERQRALAWTDDQRCGQWIKLRIGIVRQQAGRGNDQRGVLKGGVGVGHRDGGGIDSRLHLVNPIGYEGNIYSIDLIASEWWHPGETCGTYHSSEHHGVRGVPRNDEFVTITTDFRFAVD